MISSRRPAVVRLSHGKGHSMRRSILLPLALAALLAVSAAFAPGAAAQDGVVCVEISVFGVGTSFCVPTDDVATTTTTTTTAVAVADVDIDNAAVNDNLNDACTFQSHVSQTGDANTSRSVVTVSTTCRTGS